MALPTMRRINMSEEKPPRFLSRQQLRERGINYSNPHMLRLEAEGKIPRRVYLSPGRVAWVETEILAYIERCIKARG
jgi:prophage regulatory protein